MAGDTTPVQSERHAALLRAMTSEQRALALRSVDRGVRRLALARLRNLHPDESEQQLVIRHVAHVHGLDTARRLYGALLPGLEK